MELGRFGGEVAADERVVNTMLDMARVREELEAIVLGGQVQ